MIYGAVLGAKAAEESGRTTAILFRGVAAIIEAYLIYWALVYLIARKAFGFSREWAAPLASGISICGVTAAITTGAAIRARPVVPIMVSSLVVVFAVMEMLLLPGLAHVLLPNEPMVAAGWMGLAVKTDGAAFSSGEITAGLFYPEETDPARKWMALTTTTVKVFIDVFIGIWAIILSAIWAWKIDKRENGKLPLREIWDRFPKFVFGYALTFGAFYSGRLVSTRCHLRFEARDQSGRCLSPDLLRPDLLQHRPGNQHPPALGRWAGPARPRLCGEPVRICDLDRVIDLLALLSRHARNRRQVRWKHPKFHPAMKRRLGNWRA